MELIPTERPVARRLRPSTVAGVVVLASAVVAIIGSEREVAISVGIQGTLGLEDALWGLGGAFGGDGDFAMVRAFAMLLIASGIAIIRSGCRSYFGVVTALLVGGGLVATAVEWWDVAAGLTIQIEPFDFPWGYRKGDAMYYVGAAGVLAIAGGLAAMFSPRPERVEQVEYPGRAVV